MVEFTSLGVKPPEASQTAKDDQQVRTSPWSQVTRRSFSAKGGVQDLRSLYRSLDLSRLRDDNVGPADSQTRLLGPSTRHSGEIEVDTAKEDDFLQMNSPGRESSSQGQGNQEIQGSLTQRHVDRPAQLAIALRHVSAFASDLPDIPSELDHASSMAHPTSNTERAAPVQGSSSPMMEEELEEGCFHETPLEVDHGVAVLEESVELGVPDVITQA